MIVPDSRVEMARGTEAQQYVGVERLVNPASKGVNRIVPGATVSVYSRLPKFRCPMVYSSSMECKFKISLRF